MSWRRPREELRGKDGIRHSSKLCHHAHTTILPTRHSIWSITRPRKVWSSISVPSEFLCPNVPRTPAGVGVLHAMVDNEVLGAVRRGGKACRACQQFPPSSEYGKTYWHDQPRKRAGEHSDRTHNSRCSSANLDCSWDLLRAPAARDSSSCYQISRRYR